ncbi:MATE family efflux transporter [Lacrimispora saccharolytica]|uniref:Multidrug export protein MepA n=1 Tax=Lacrimispora saccharolytica (strain ATCC 35040 / DSM 2544 / NRCC 2533 / WM1) TaxID=610130 RepID=D9R2X3_LACSW|nr:MATE family efflux transporter [Lacrimispora saccharolytica]ADL02963.1 MATE efflux family protein [[Clostridium] saccharolyticum WM1]QRV18845.1 MATE family efflux transporter [Lacrimispora saccharolytica]
MEQNKMKQGENPLGYKPVGHLLLQFALPAIIAMLVNSIYNIVDQIFIGQGIGYLGNAATTIAFPIVTIILAISTLLGAGGSAYAAIKLGEKNEKEADKTLGTVFAVTLAASVVVMAVAFPLMTPMLKVFGATENTMGYARQYTSVILMGTPFNMLSVVLSNMARTDGNPSLSMYAILVGAVLNTILDPVYIFVFHWGVTGAAIATITSQIISAVVLVHYFIFKGKHMRLHRKGLSIDGKICRLALPLGISSGITQVASTILQVVMNNSLVYYGNQTDIGGDVALSAMGVVNKIGMILISICIGIGIGSQPILGFNKGANQPKRMRRTFLLAAGAATAVSITGWLACQIFPGQILSLFGTKDVLFTQFAIRCLKIYMLGIFSAGFQVVTTSYFQSTGQPLKASVLSMLRQLLLLIPLILTLPLTFGLEGILYAGPAADITSMIIVSQFVLYEMRKLNRFCKDT